MRCPSCVHLAMSPLPALRTARPAAPCWKHRPSTNSSVRQLEIIQEIAMHCGDGLEFMRDHHGACAQGFRGQHHALDRASFLEFFFSQLFEGMQFKRRRRRIYSSVRRERYTGEGIRRYTQSSRAAALQGENGRRCFLTHLAVRAPCRGQRAGPQFLYAFSCRRSGRCRPSLCRISLLFEEYADPG